VTDPRQCTHCGAAMTEADQWCSLCLTPVAPAPGPAAPPPVGGPVLPTQSAAPIVAPPPAGPPILPPELPGEAPGGSGGSPPVDPDAMIAMLAASERQSAKPLLASATRGRRVAIMVGGAVAIIVVLTVGMLLMSLVLG
jgi:hypothetical protein